MRPSIVDHAVTLLDGYSFDLDGYRAEQLVAEWMDYYQPHWIKLAVIEALYQGRYKAISVVQILAFWKRRGEPLCHFNAEFAQMVCEHVLPVVHQEAIGATLPSTSPDVTAACQPQLLCWQSSDKQSASSTIPDPWEEPPTHSILPEQGVSEQSPSEPEPMTCQPIQPIHQFVPPTDTSEFYAKLKAVAATKD
ncbi:MAG: hypothetical protein NZ772_13600 [Cyanobacteria bacterium]|nr:hypothetical protein [Cyanobacteriota bacterium]